MGDGKLGKKEAAIEKAREATLDSEWGDDLAPRIIRSN
jgi:hypothetical protein